MVEKPDQVDIVWFQQLIQHTRAGEQPELDTIVLDGVTSPADDALTQTEKIDPFNSGRLDNRDIVRICRKEVTPVGLRGMGGKHAHHRKGILKVPAYVVSMFVDESNVHAVVIIRYWLFKRSHFVGQSSQLLNSQGSRKSGFDTHRCISSSCSTRR